MLLTITGLDPKMKTAKRRSLVGLSERSIFAQTGSGSLTTWRFTVAPEQIYRLKLQIPGHLPRVGQLVSPAASWPTGQTWRPTVLLRSQDTR